MRKKREKQRPLSPQWPDHQLAHELKVISRILDDNPETLELIVQGLTGSIPVIGATVTAEQECCVAPSSSCISSAIASWSFIW